MTTNLPSDFLSTLDAREVILLDSKGYLPELFDGVTEVNGQVYLRFETVSELLRYLRSIEQNGLAAENSAIVMPLSLLARKNYEVVRRVRSHSIIFNIPIFGLNDAAFSKEQIMEAVRNGVDDVYNETVTLSKISKAIEQVGQMRFIASQVETNMDNAASLVNLPFYKRLVDIVLALIGLIPLSLLFIILAAAIRLDSKGPIFYSQWRRGMNGRKFRFWKFRSMYTDADKRLADLAHLNQYSGNSKFFKIENDPRITRVGSIIRNSSIDELPQIFNVLLGDMSIVGNRPLPLYEANEMTADSTVERYLAPAGMTGLWQVSKRGGTEMTDEERIQLDINYARSYNLIGDFRIIYRTPRAMIQKSNV